jgi:hypothetical protein
MGFVDILMDRSKVIKDEILFRKYGPNIHDIDLKETIKTGIEDRLIGARELNIPYCVVFGGVVPAGTGWDRYGNGDWNPPRDYITTEDIATDDNNREIERQNVFAFLRGEEVVRNSEKGKEL